MKTKIISFIVSVFAIFCLISKVSAEPSNIIDDLGFSGSKQENFPISEWIESEKVLYRGLLTRDSYDVLIVPVQVQGYAFDRANRSLITRNLSYIIETTTGFKVPDPTLVERSLGERGRRFSDNEIYQLANELKVKYLIKGYTGHNLDEKLMLTLLIQERDKNGILNPQTKVIRLDWKEIPFSDEHPPAEAFNGIWGDVISKLPFPKTKKPKPVIYQREKNITVPETVSAMLKNKPASPVLSAYYLQLLGVLYPKDNAYIYSDDNADSEYLFERSLITLNSIASKSPDYAILKARALFYLHSRPAALASLGSPKTPDEKAFFALLNGNLLEMEKWIEQITSPLHRLIAQIELNDLRWNYSSDLPKKETYEIIAQEFPDWAMIILRRLHKDMWDEQSNISIKKRLDEAFPIPGFTAENIIKNKIALREFPFSNNEIDFSVYNHYRKVVEIEGQRFCCIKEASNNPVEMDYLNLLYTIGETNLWKRINLLIYGKGLYREALEVLDNYGTIYRGNLTLTYLRSVALINLSQNKVGEEATNLNKTINELEHNLCYWLQGQALFYRPECLYEGDYPGYLGRFQAADRNVLKKYSVIKGNPSSLRIGIKYLNKLELNLLYTHNDFSRMKTYLDALMDIKMFKEADALLELNNDRFAGNPRRAIYLAEHMREKGNVSDAIRAYEETITRNPEVWEPYDKLGKFYIKQGEYKKAFDVFNNYPLFKEETADKIGLSNYAMGAGIQFYRRGAINEAKNFFKLSSGYHTGSMAEMVSSGYLSLLQGDYRQAASNFLDIIKRYDNEYGYMLYICMLHQMGYNQEAWSIFNNYNKKITPVILLSAIVGNRMEGKTDVEQRKQLLEVNLQKPSPDDAVTYFFLNRIIDRPPDQNLAQSLKEIYRQFTPTNIKNQRPYSSPQTMFADGYYFVRNKNFGKAFSVFQGLIEMSNSKQMPNSNGVFTYKDYSYAIPYFAISGVKTNNIKEVEKQLELLKDEYKDEYDLHYHLAKAFISGGQNKHQEAISHLKSALYNHPGLWEFPLPPWYQLVEACEWLYEDTRYDEYRKLALEWAKTHQQILPMFAWAYAVEAKLTNIPDDRIRALALTLYLDKNSERISNFSKEEKEKALEWLKKNNPFLKEYKKEIES